MGTFWEPFGNLEGTLWTLGNLSNLEGTLGTFTWEPLLGNLYLGTFNWEPLLGNLGTFTWEPVLGTCTWNLGTLGESVLELLRSAPKPLLWLKTPKHSAVGEKSKSPQKVRGQYHVGEKVGGQLGHNGIASHVTPSCWTKVHLN